MLWRRFEHLSLLFLPLFTHPPQSPEVFSRISDRIFPISWFGARPLNLSKWVEISRPDTTFSDEKTDSRKDQLLYLV